MKRVSSSLLLVFPRFLEQSCREFPSFASAGKAILMEGLKSVLLQSGLTVSSSPETGRCLLTERDFSPGEIIIRQDPYVSVPNISKSGSRCEVCFASSNLKKCSACHVVWYCGRTCQRSDWRLHHDECLAISKLTREKRKALTPSIRLMLKLYLKRKLQIEKIIPTSATDNYRLVESLVSHMPKISEKQLVLYAQMANLVHLTLQWPNMNLKEIAENFSKLACNAHSISDSDLRPLGTGLYLAVSIINHSCSPNAVLMFEGREAVVRAVQYLPKGTEIQISYIETAGSISTRQKTLKEQYFFTCSCPRCINLGHACCNWSIPKGQEDDIRESAILEGYRCKNDRCDGFLLRHPDGKAFICQKCNHMRSKEEIQKIAQEVKLMSDQASSAVDSKNYHEACTVFMAVEKLQVKLCHPFSLCLMRTRDSLLKIFMDLNDWQEALNYCKLTIPVYEKVYPECHPMRGLQYYTCGKLEWLLEDTESAIISFSKAYDILKITHGKNTPFVKELRVKLEEAHAEASYKSSRPLMEED